MLRNFFWNENKVSISQFTQIEQISSNNQRAACGKKNDQYVQFNKDQNNFQINQIKSPGKRRRKIFQKLPESNDHSIVEIVQLPTSSEVHPYRIECTNKEIRDNKEIKEYQIKKTAKKNKQNGLCFGKISLNGKNSRSKQLIIYSAEEITKEDDILIKAENQISDKTHLRKNENDKLQRTLKLQELEKDIFDASLEVRSPKLESKLYFTKKNPEQSLSYSSSTKSWINLN